MNPVIIFHLKTYDFPISNDFTQMFNFATMIPDYDSFSPALMNFFLSCNPSSCSTLALHPLEKPDHVVVSVSTDFSSNSKDYTPFHRTAYYYSLANWDGLFESGFMKGYLYISCFCSTTEFCEWVQVGIDEYISLIVNVKSIFIHFHGFQQLLLLPYLWEMTSFICTKRINPLHLKWSLDRLVIAAKVFSKGLASIDQSSKVFLIVGSSIKYVRKIFRKTNISNLLIRTRMCGYQGVRKISFSENSAYAITGFPLNG